MNKRKYIEAFKNILIVLLIVSAIILGWESRLFGNTAGGIDGFMQLLRDTSESGPAAPVTAEPALPVAIAVTDGAGSRYGVRYDRQELGRLYDNTARFFLDALSSAQTPEEIGSEEWRSALQSLGVYAEYISPVKLSVLGGWFGAIISADWGSGTVRRLCVTGSGGENYLIFQDDATGKFYKARTGTLGSISAQADTLKGNGAVFAFEISGKSGAPYALLTPAVTAHPAFDVTNPLTDKTAKSDVLLALGISDLLKLSYNVDGTDVFPGDDYTTYLSADGTITRTAKSQKPVVRVISESEAVDTAAALVANTLGKYCGSDAAVAYVSSRELTVGVYQVFFRYVVAGGAVWLSPDGYAASVTVRDGAVGELKLRFRAFAVSDAPSPLLPEVQAAAAAEGDFMLGYDDDSSGRLTPSWVKLPLSS